MWIDMHRGEGTVILNLLLSGTSSPTALHFIKNEEMVEGEGEDFLKDRVGGNLKDLKKYRCKAVVVLESIHEGDMVNINLAALSVIFAEAPVRPRFCYSDEEKQAALSAAKRMKYSW